MTYWTCRRQKDGRVCGQRNTGRKRLCTACGKARPPKRRQKHLVALEQSYEAYVAMSGGERCCICLRPRSEEDRRKLARDHDHRTGRARGLLCFRCNTGLRYWMTPEWLDAAAVYLRRTAVPEEAAW